MTDYMLDLDRNLPQTMHEQACNAIVAAIHSAREGFRVGDRLINQELARQNPIHRNTLAAVMGELVRMGYLRRLPNKGFEVVARDPERPSLLTRHILSLSEVAERERIESRSQLVENATGEFMVDRMASESTRIKNNLDLSDSDRVSVLTRCRLLKQKNDSKWTMMAIEQSCFATALAPGLVEAAAREIEETGDTAIYRLLRRIYPNDEFFKAHYEISLDPLPASLASSWAGTTDRLISVLTVTYCSQGPVEMTRTWFDASKAILTAGTLDVKLI